MKNGIIICRVSGDGQVDGTSLDTQEKEGLEYCRLNDINPVHIIRFDDKGISAKSSKLQKVGYKRRDLEELFSWCKKQKPVIDYAIFNQLDRVARDITDYFVVRGKLANYKTKIVSVTEQFEDTIEGVLIEAITAWKGEKDNKDRMKRTKDGIHARKKDGYYIAPYIPLGYKRANTSDKLKYLIPIPDENYEFVKEGWNMLLKGYSIASIAKYLNRNYVKTKKNLPITFKNLPKTFRNKFYAGIIESKILGIDVKGKHQPMISEDDFWQAQRMLNKTKNRKQTTKINELFNLQKLIHCQCCGNVLATSKSKGKLKYYEYYECSNSLYCENRQRIALKQAEKDFEMYLDTLHKEIDFDLIKIAIIDEYQSQFSKIQTEIEEAQKEKDSILKKIKRVNLMREEGEYSSEEYRDRKDELENQLISIQVPTNDMKIKSLDLDYSITCIETMYFNLSNTWKRLAPEAKQEFYNLMFPNGLEYKLGTYRTLSNNMLDMSIEAIVPVQVSNGAAEFPFIEHFNPFEAIIKFSNQLNSILNVNLQV